MSGDIFVWNWPGPHAFEPDVQYVHFLGPFSLRCRWLVLSEAWGYGRSGNQVPPPALAVTCLESSATVASARCIVRSLGSVYSTGTGHKAQGVIYRLYFLSISQYIIIYIYNLIYGICPRHRYIHIYIWSTYHSLGICICTYMQPCLNPPGNIVWILLWIPQGFQTNWTLISLIYSF